MAKLSVSQSLHAKGYWAFNVEQKCKHMGETSGGSCRREGILTEVRKGKVNKYCNWKRRPESLLLTTIEEYQGKEDLTAD